MAKTRLALCAVTRKIDTPAIQPRWTFTLILVFLSLCSR